MKKTLFLYAFVLVVFGLGMFFTMDRGEHLASRSTTTKPVSIMSLTSGDGTRSIWTALDANLQEPLSRLLIQFLVILITTRSVGSLFARMGQPLVVGEMIAGVLLGPSLFGALFPTGFQFVFPDHSLGTLRLLSQVGVCLFLFVVGMELDARHLRNQAHTVVIVSHVSILFPYFLGVVTSLLLFPKLAGPGTSFVSFALFMGISMSITAFPVLARILQERGMARTPLGSTAITCAAVDDVTAWIILAFVVAVARATGLAATLLGLGLVLVYVAVMLWGVKPQLPRWLGLEASGDGTLGKGQTLAVLAFMFASALATEVVGIHALFGSFLAGVIMPAKPEIRDYLKVRIESFSLIFLLPLFFAFTGLRTQIGLLDNATDWWLCLLIIFVATVGKLGGSMLTARFTGMAWTDSFALGALMNTRGLMELIAINIGYELGILSPHIFTMLVLMALVTTLMTSPLLTLAEFLKRRQAQAP